MIQEQPTWAGGSKLGFQPVVIIGAGRSGTNLLRDLLTDLPGIATWPCDEINYIWRHGHARVLHDEFPREFADGKTRDFIRRRFVAQARVSNCEFLVEKTCANSLRVGFVDAIFPEAKFIFLVRDGRDVVASACERWRAQLDIPYVLRKARFVPLLDVPFHAARYLSSRFGRLLTSERRLSTWGPRPKDFDRVIASGTLEEICALQWQACVTAAQDAFRLVEPQRVLRLSYEELVGTPGPTLAGIQNFLGCVLPADYGETRLDHVNTRSVGSWMRKLNSDQVRRIVQLIEEDLAAFGYSTTSSARGGRSEPLAA